MIKQKLLSAIPDSILSIIEPLYYKLQLYNSKLRYRFLGKKRAPKDIPIVINNYNRLEYLKKLINSLKSRGYYNIHILDNASTYPPLLDFYKNTDVNVIYLGKNWGFRAIWESGVVKQFWDSYYVYTDADMELTEDCPADFMEYFLRILDKYSSCFKVGFGIKIDDLPDYFKHKNQVIEHESQFWKDEVELGLYKAPLDTTFALYRPYTGTSANSKKMNIRTAYPYIIRHLPWYINSDRLSEEELYYINSISKSTHWSVINKESNS